MLAATHLFFDRRLATPGDEALFHRLEHLGQLAVDVFSEPDAGPWELRGEGKAHTHSAVMCWAACDRLAKIAGRLGLATRALYWSRQARRLHESIYARAWNEELGSFTGSFEGEPVRSTTRGFRRPPC